MLIVWRRYRLPNTERWWKWWQEKTEALREKSVPVPLCPLQISHGLAWDRIQVSEPVNQPPEPLNCNRILNMLTAVGKTPQNQISWNSTILYFVKISPSYRRQIWRSYFLQIFVGVFFRYCRLFSSVYNGLLSYWQRSLSIRHGQGEESNWDWRELHNWGLYVLDSSPNIIRVMELGTNRRSLRGACMEEIRNNCVQSFDEVTWREEITWKISA